jgi:hypothetical protein
MIRVLIAIAAIAALAQDPGSHTTVRGREGRAPRAEAPRPRPQHTDDHGPVIGPDGTTAPDVHRLQAMCRHGERVYHHMSAFFFGYFPYPMGLCDEPREYMPYAMEGYDDCMRRHTSAHDPWTDSSCATPAAIAASHLPGYWDCMGFHIRADAFVPHERCNTADKIARFQLQGYEECFTYHRREQCIEPENDCRNEAEIQLRSTDLYRGCFYFYKYLAHEAFPDLICSDIHEQRNVALPGYQECFLSSHRTDHNGIPVSHWSFEQMRDICVNPERRQDYMTRAPDVISGADPGLPADSDRAPAVHIEDTPYDRGAMGGD